MHNPVPFDFVPFSTQHPVVGSSADWESIGEGSLFCGHINYRLHIRTPLHIVGEQFKNSRNTIEISRFHKNHGAHLIPGSGLKGMLRGFVETLTNSWVSQATDEYEAVRDERTRAFTAFSKPSEGALGPVIPAWLHPNAKEGNIDLATFIFGAVLESNEDGNAHPSRLIFEDINLDSKVLVDHQIKLPDVPGQAFMGGPKPRINNWWYFSPQMIQVKRFNRFQNTDFIGRHFWGRKFYYHQNPEYALAWYADPRNWPHVTQKKIGGNRYKISSNYREYPLQVIPSKTILSGRIYFENLPAKLLALLMLAINPNGMAHKLGYGQAFGLGSIQFEITDVYASANQGFDISENPIKLDPKHLMHEWYQQFVDPTALKWLKRILHYDSAELDRQDHLFTYPCFGPVINSEPGTYDRQPPRLKEAEFQKLVQWADARREATRAGAAPSGDQFDLTLKQARDVAEGLWRRKKAIHFRLYQERSRLWERIRRRA